MIAIGNRTLREIADALEGTVTGDPATRVRAVATLEAARPGDLVFLFDARKEAAAGATRASAMVLARGAPAPAVPSVHVADPKVAFATILRRFGASEREPGGIHPSAVVDPTARLAPDVEVGALAVVGARATIGARTVVGPRAHVGADVAIGEDCRLASGAAVLDGCRAGDRLVLHAHAVVGSVGFNFVNDGTRAVRVPHLAAVRIGDDVEIGACTCIDRGILEDTVIGDRVKIDNLVQVAHNVRIGEGTIVCAQVGLSGSGVIGPGCVFGGQAGTVDRVHIGAGSRIGARAAVMKSFPAGSRVTGAPARPLREWLRGEAEARSASRRIAKLEEKLRPAPRPRRPASGSRGR